MRLRAADLRCGSGRAALLLAVAAGIAGAQLPGRAQAMVGGAPTAPGEFGRSVIISVYGNGDRPRRFADCGALRAAWRRLRAARRRARAAAYPQGHRPHRTPSAI